MLHENQAFSHQRIEVDGNQYNRCKFVHCTLVYSGNGGLGLEGCSFDTCRWVLDGPAGKTLKFLRLMYHHGFREMVEQTFENIRSNNPNNDRK